MLKLHETILTFFQTRNEGENRVAVFCLLNDLKIEDELTVSYNWNFNYFEFKKCTDTKEKTKTLSKEQATICHCNNKSCRLFVEKDLADIMENALKKVRNCESFKHSEEILLAPELKDISVQKNRNQLLYNLNKFREKNCAEESIICSIVYVLLQYNTPHAQIYKYGFRTDLTVQQIEEDSNLKQRAYTWVSKKATIGKLIMFWNEAISKQSTQISYCYTGSMREVEQMARKFNCWLDNAPKNEQLRVQKIIRKIFNKVNTDSLLLFE